MDLKQIDSTSLEIKAIHTSFSSNSIKLHQNANLIIDVSLSITNLCANTKNQNDGQISTTDFESEKEEMGNQLEEHFQSGEMAKKPSFHKVVSSSKQTQSHRCRSGK